MAQTFTVYTAKAVEPYQEAYDEYIKEINARYNAYAKAKPFVAIADETKPLTFALWAKKAVGEIDTLADFVTNKTVIDAGSEDYGSED